MAQLVPWTMLPHRVFCAALKDFLGKTVMKTVATTLVLIAICLVSGIAAAQDAATSADTRSATPAAKSEAPKPEVRKKAKVPKKRKTAISN